MPHRTTIRGSGGIRWIRGATLAGVFCAALCARVGATPPEYKTFEREQRVNYSPDAGSLMRIWVVYVGQGDGVLIQLPTKFNASAGLDDDDRFDVLIDGGSFNLADAERIERFIGSLYPDGASIELSVISHHDQDHVAGMTRLLDAGPFPFGRVVHNGLASYKGGAPGIPTHTPFDGVADAPGGAISRALGALEDDAPNSRAIVESHAVNTIDDLRDSFDAGHLQGVYWKLAKAVLERHDRGELDAFDRVMEGESLVDLVAADGAAVTLGVVWPQERLRPHNGKSWSHTINGNSVTVRLDYGEFSMLLTGDHNKHSQRAWLDALGNDRSVLRCDVLKVPHHGSHDADEKFFREPANDEKTRPVAVLSVASMGDRGFSPSWKHPANDVVQWLGGAHRFYSTHIHERRFDWTDISDADLERMVERSHVLIETDGAWFRVVEIPADAIDPLQIPGVHAVKRGDGTRWINAADAND